jgi:hypothetical protein
MYNGFNKYKGESMKNNNICKNCKDTLDEGITHIPANELEDGKLVVMCIVKGVFRNYNNLLGN